MPARMRPRFRVETGVRPAEILAGLSGLLADESGSVEGGVFNESAMMWLPRERRRFFSPCLHVTFADMSEDSERWTLQGRFAPHPNVWTGFMAIYGVLSMSALFSLVLGYGQWSIGEAPWGLVGFVAGVSLIGFVYGAAFIGQGLSAGQMYELRRHLDDVLRGVEAGIVVDAEPAGLTAPSPD